MVLNVILSLLLVSSLYISFHSFLGDSSHSIYRTSLCLDAILAPLVISNLSFCSIYSYFGQAFVACVPTVPTAQILAAVFIGLNNFFSGLIVRPQYLSGFFEIP